MQYSSKVKSFMNNQTKLYSKSWLLDTFSNMSHRHVSWNLYPTLPGLGMMIAVIIACLLKLLPATIKAPKIFLSFKFCFICCTKGIAWRTKIINIQPRTVATAAETRSTALCCSAPSLASVKIIRYRPGGPFQGSMGWKSTS